MKIILNQSVPALLLLFASAIHAATPEHIADQYYQLIDANQWSNIADMMHETALTEFKTKLLPTLKPLNHSGKSGLLKKTFGKEATYEDASKASNKEFFVNVVGNVASLVRNTGIRNTQTTVIGKMPEGKDVVHVLVRETYRLGEIKISNMEVLSFKKSGDGWALLLSGKIRGLVQTLQTSTYHIRQRKKNHAIK
ncbi:hypothetical protein [Kaarinaea lacus]